jgi:hypothetical protein
MFNLSLIQCSAGRGNPALQVLCNRAACCSDNNILDKDIFALLQGAL